MAGVLTIRPAALADARFLLTLRNESEVVSASKTDSLVDERTHAAWLARSLESPARQLFVVCLDGAPIGQARLDATDGSQWVSIALTADHRGGGHGSAVLRELQAAADGDLCAEVRHTNGRSLAMFHRAGFHRSSVNEGFVQLTWANPAKADPGQGPAPVRNGSYAT